MAHDPASAPARASQRDSLLLAATLRRVGEADIVLRVRNLSAGGLMADHTGTLRPGAAVDVELRGIGSVPACIAWSRKGRVGLSFGEEINPRLARGTPPHAGSARFEPTLAMLDGRSRRPALRS